MAVHPRGILIAPRTTTPVELLGRTLSHRGFEPRDNVAHTPPPPPVGGGSTVPALPRRIGAGRDQQLYDLHRQGFVIRQPPERRDPFRADRSRQTRIVSQNRTHSIDAAVETQRPDIMLAGERVLHVAQRRLLRRPGLGAHQTRARIRIALAQGFQPASGSLP